MTRVAVETRIDASKGRGWDVIADLGAGSVWNPALADSHYTSAAKGGLEASRHCDFTDGGYVKESVVEWRPGEAFTVEILEGTVPFASARGSMSVSEDGDGTIVAFALEYELK